MTALDFFVLVWALAAILAGMWALDAQFMTIWDLLVEELRIYVWR